MKPMGGWRSGVQTTANGRSTDKRRHSRGQSLVEFSLVLPVLLFMLFGALEGGFLMFVVGTARYGAEEVARQESQSANSLTADADSIAVLRKTAIGTTTLGQVTEIDIIHLVEQGNGTLVEDPAHINKYKLDGSCLAGCGSNTYPSATRNVINDQSDFLKVTVYYQYNWLSGKIVSKQPVMLQTSFEIRLEPQTY
jgi:Flp pilus assembly protein TadG